MLSHLQEIKHNLDVARTALSGMRLEPKCRQQLALLLQRQHLEEEELRLRHYMELEKFQRNLDLSEWRCGSPQKRYSYIRYGVVFKSSLD